MMTLGVSLITAFYTFRLGIIVFHGSSQKDDGHSEHEALPSVSFYLPLILLAVPAVFAGLVGIPAIFTGSEPMFFEYIVRNFPVALNEFVRSIQNPLDHAFEIKLIAAGIAAAVTGSTAAIIYYGIMRRRPAAEGAFRSAVARLSLNRLYIDEIYQFVFVTPYKTLAQTASQWEIKVLPALSEGLGAVYAGDRRCCCPVADRLSCALCNGWFCRYSGAARFCYGGSVMLAIAILTPLCVGLVILFLKEERADAKFQSRNALAAIATTLAVFAVAVAAQTRFAGNYGEAQLKEVWYTFTGAGLNLVFALDGLSMPLFLSTAFLFLIAALFSLNLQKLQTGAGSAPVLTRQFWASLLFLESIVLGVFAAYNFIVFFMLWELFLIPVVILMWRFGLEERKAAAARFFIYTFVSSAFMLAAFAALVYYTPRVGADFDFKTTFASELQLVHFEKQRLIFLFFIIAFLVKMPVFPFHAWLPLTHTQAPLGTLLLSGLFLKLGSYGVLRFITPNFSGVIAEWGSIFISLGIFSMLYGAFVAYRQQSFRFVIAYSSLSHMGLLFAGTLTNNEYGVTGAIIQNVGHSLANALLFVIVTMHLVRS
jgi:NADH-quinone oxidoreductase subunit M